MIKDDQGRVTVILLAPIMIISINKYRVCNISKFVILRNLTKMLSSPIHEISKSRINNLELLVISFQSHKTYRDDIVKLLIKLESNFAAA